MYTIGNPFSGFANGKKSTKALPLSESFRIGFIADLSKGSTTSQSQYHKLQDKPGEIQRKNILFVMPRKLSGLVGARITWTKNKKPFLNGRFVDNLSFLKFQGAHSSTGCRPASPTAPRKAALCIDILCFSSLQAILVLYLSALRTKIRI
jgi:hypothetical protein